MIPLNPDLIKLANDLVYEIYFWGNIYKNEEQASPHLWDTVVNLLQPIEYEKWDHYFWEESISGLDENQKQEYTQLTETIRITIKDFLNQTMSDSSILIYRESINNYPFTTYIEKYIEEELPSLDEEPEELTCASSNESENEDAEDSGN